MAYNTEIKKEDIQMSSIVSEFVKTQFYDIYTHELEVVEDKKRQVQGIDSIFTIDEQKYYCDEKSAVRYRNIKTFALELSFLNKFDELMNGWFVSDKMINDCYLFIWIDRSSSDTSDKKVIRQVSDIKEAEIMLVRKDDIFEYLRKLGWTKERLLRKSERIRCEGDRNFGDLFYDGCRFSYSEMLAEKPINILLPRKELRKIAIKDKIIRE